VHRGALSVSTLLLVSPIGLRKTDESPRNALRPVEVQDCTGGGWISPSASLAASARAQAGGGRSPWPSIGRPPARLPCYRGSIMRKREGGTAKISISLRRSELASLKKRAKRLYAGNVSAVISELAADAELLEGMHELVNWLGGPSLTDAERKGIDREWSGQTRAPKRVRKNKNAA
jgi:hypothetical protein